MSEYDRQKDIEAEGQRAMILSLPRSDYIPPTIPMPLSRSHAELMLLVAQRYLDDNPMMQDEQSDG